MIELKSCEFRGKLTVAGIKVSGSKENAQFSSTNLHKLGPRAAKKLTVAGIKIRLIELESCELLQKLALPELKSAELRNVLYGGQPPGRPSTRGGAPGETGDPEAPGC